jgi:hypothetical protein
MSDFDLLNCVEKHRQNNIAKYRESPDLHEDLTLAQKEWFLMCIENSIKMKSKYYGREEKT